MQLLTRARRFANAACATRNALNPARLGSCPIIHLDPKRGVKRRSNGDVASVNSDDSSGDDE